MEYVSITLMVVSMVLMIIMKGKNKGKSGNIGKRYWADTIQGLATYSPRTATLWVNRVFDSSENGCMVAAHLPYAGSVGQSWWVHNIGETNMATSGFSLPYIPDIDWESQDALNARRNCIPNMAKDWSGNQNPAYPCHYQGAAVLVCNQIYLGLNGAQYPSYNAIISSIPGTVYELMASAPEYNNMDYWVRWRYTTDCGQTISLNPVAIVADILLDQKKIEDIDWVSFAQAGRKLHKEFPYMWFAMQFGETTIKDATESVLSKARLAIKTMPDGRLGLRVVGEMPDDGILGLTMIDALTELTEFSLSRSAVDSDEVINIASGSYAAARADSAVSTVYDVYSQIVPFSEMDAFSNWMAENQSALVGKSIYEVVQMYPGYKSEWDIAHAANTVAAMGKNEWHYKTADVYAINAANIVATGVRKKETFDLDYFNWPDDASAALQDTLAEREKPYAIANTTSGMRLWDKTVGDSIRLAIKDPASAVSIDKVFLITDMEMAGFPDETIQLTLKEHAKWYDVFSLPQGATGGTDPSKAVVYPPNSAISNEDGSYTLSDGTLVYADGTVTVPAGSVYNDSADVWTTPGGYRFYDDGTLLDATWGYVVLPPRTAEPNSSPAPQVPEAPYRPVPDTLFQLPMVGQITSPFIRGGMPASNFCVSWATGLLTFTKEYLVDSCSPDAVREPDNLIAMGGKSWPFNFTLDEPLVIPERAEGMLETLEVNATMWIPDIANIDECAKLLRQNTTSVGGLSGFMYDTEYDGVGYFLVSAATKNTPYGTAMMLRYTYMESYTTDGGVHVRLRGIYLCDKPMALNLPAGSVISLLPNDSNALTTGSSAYPVPEGYGLMAQASGQVTHIKTIPATNSQELLWSRCFCTEYKALPEHNETPEFTVWVAAEDSLTGPCGIGGAVYIDSALDSINVWINAHDFRTTQVDPKLMNTSIPRPPSGLDPIMSGKDTACVKSVADAQAGVRGFVSTFMLYHNCALKVTEKLLNNPLHHKFCLNDYNLSAIRGDRIDVKIVGRYDYYTDFPDVPASSQEIIVAAPQILVI